MTRTLRIGTRSSQLALWQANRVTSLIAALPGAPATQLVHIRTEGDVRTDVPLWAVDGRAFFTKEIDRALLAGEIDVAVHSLKDLTTQMERGIVLAAVLTREDPRDALLCREVRGLADLPPGAKVGTSSLRRRAFLRRARPDIELIELRGNVPTRIEKLDRGDYDAIVLATAGLKRLGLDGRITAHLPAEDFPPAVSQGAIGVCCRADDQETMQWLAPLDDHATRIATTAERALLRRIEGGCQVPLGALARVEGDRLRMHAAVCTLDGTTMLRTEGEMPASVDDASRLGERLAEDLLAQGADRIIAQQRPGRPQVAAP